jgi:hypothetical protein
MGIIRYSIKISIKNVSLLFISHQHYLNHSLQPFIHFNPFTLHLHKLISRWPLIYMIIFANYEPVNQWTVSFPHHPGSSHYSQYDLVCWVCSFRISAELLLHSLPSQPAAFRYLCIEVMTSFCVSLTQNKGSILTT